MSCKSKYSWKLKVSITEHESLVDDDRFWLKVNKSPGFGPNGDCWVWRGSKDGGGYGKYSVNRVNIPAHRYSFKLANPDVNMEKLFVFHKCDNPICVNPEHLWLGTHGDNMRDKVRKGRGYCGDKNILKDVQCKEIKKQYASGYSKNKLSFMYGVSTTTIRNVIEERAAYKKDKIHKIKILLNDTSVSKLRLVSTKMGIDQSSIAAMILESVLSTNEWSFIDAGETNSEDVSNKEGSK